MIHNPAVTATYAGLTHECMDPHCHVPGFLASLNDHLGGSNGPTTVFEETHPRLRVVKEDK